MEVTIMRNVTHRFGLLTLPLLLSIATGCASDKAIIAQAVDAHGQIEPAVITDRDLAGYIQDIGDRVVDVAKELDEQGYGPKITKGKDNAWMFEGVRFHLVNSPTLNAFTTGGQHVYLYSELFTQSKTEDEFAAVVAHEFAHIYGRHVQKGTNRQYAVLGAAAAAAVGGYALGGENREMMAGVAGGGALAAGQFLGMGFTRDDEDEADKLGFKFYTMAGWDPEHFPDFFKQMIEKGHDKTPEIASSHPKLANRVANAERRAKELPPTAEQWRRDNVASARQFARYQDRARALAKNAPKDRSLESAQLMLAAFPSCVAPEDLPEQKQAQSTVVKKLQADDAQGEAPRKAKRRRAN
ncbi:MAG TPA: M48 family metallopeptidase [Tepidisphaeraceae bacterium]